MNWYAAQTSNNGGTSVPRRDPLAWSTADRTSPPFAAGNSDHKSATAPATKGAAALVPLNVSGFPSAPRLVMSSLGARRPRLPMERARFDWLIGLPRRSHATTGRTHGWRVIAELPLVPSFSAAA